MKEQAIVDQALENLRNYAGLDGRWLPTKNPEEVDGKLVLTYGKNRIELKVVVKQELRNRQLLQLEKLAGEYENFMVITERIFPKIKEELRKQNIAYLEGSGNLYLNNGKFFIWLETNKPAEAIREKLNRAFTKTGLKVLFFLLLEEGAENYPLRTLANETGTALGNVPNVLKGLQDAGFLLRLNDRQYKLNNKKDLLDKWMAAYTQVLKPNLEMGTFRFLKTEDFDNWKKLPLKPGKSWWGGEPAGELLTHNLKPEVLTIYTLETRNELMKHYRLIPDPKGNVNVFAKFWKQDAEEDAVAPPLLVYADLMNTGDRRCIETAERIYHDRLQDKF